MRVRGHSLSHQMIYHALKSSILPIWDQASKSMFATAHFLNLTTPHLLKIIIPLHDKGLLSI